MSGGTPASPAAGGGAVEDASACTTLLCAFRFVYWQASLVVSALAFVAGWSWFWDGGSEELEASCDAVSSVYNVWLWIRLVLAVAQIPLHGLLLHAARCSTRLHAKLVRAKVRIVTYKGFYKFALPVCNKGLAVMILAEAGVVIALFSECGTSGAAADRIKVLEVATLAIWAAVLALRGLAGATGRTKVWFTLAFSSEPSTAHKPLPE